MDISTRATSKGSTGDIVKLLKQSLKEESVILAIKELTSETLKVKMEKLRTSFEKKDEIIVELQA